MIDDGDGDDSFVGKIMVPLLPQFGGLVVVVEGTESPLLLPQLLPARSTYFAVAAADIQQETLVRIVLPSLHLRPNLGLRFVAAAAAVVAAAETTQKRRGSVGHRCKPFFSYPPSLDHDTASMQNYC